MAKRAIHLTTLHAWDDTRIFRKQCRSLAAAGLEVHLAAPDSPTGERDDVYLAPQKRFRRRAVRMTLGALHILRTAIRLNGDVYHFRDPELLGVGLILKMLGKRVIYDAHEDVAKQIRTKHWIPSVLRRPASWCFRALEQCATRRLDGVVAATPAIAQNFLPEKTALVQNFPILGELTSNKRSPPEMDAPRLAYIGGISPLRGVREVVRALSSTTHPQVRLTIAGGFSHPRLETELRQMPGWQRVDFRGWCGRDELRRILAEAALGIVTFLPAPNHIESQPNKLFEYMSAGLPVIASDFPLWRKIVEAANCGLLVDPRDPAAIARAIDWLLEHPTQAQEMGRRGQQAVAARYNWDHEVQALLKMYRGLLRVPLEPAETLAPSQRAA